MRRTRLIMRQAKWSIQPWLIQRPLIEIFIQCCDKLSNIRLAIFFTQNNNSVTTSTRYTWKFLSNHNTNLDHVNLILFIIPPITFAPCGCWPLGHTTWIGCRRYSNFVDVISSATKSDKKNLNSARKFWMDACDAFNLVHNYFTTRLEVIFDLYLPLR